MTGEKSIHNFNLTKDGKIQVKQGGIYIVHASVCTSPVSVGYYSFKYCAAFISSIIKILVLLIFLLLVLL